MSRILSTLAAGAVCAFGAVGIVVLPLGALAALVLGGLVLGVTVFTAVDQDRWGLLRRWGLRTVAVAAASGVLGAGVVVAGLIAVLGAATMPVLLLVLAAAWLWQHSLGSGAWVPPAGTDESTDHIRTVSIASRPWAVVSPRGGTAATPTLHGSGRGSDRWSWQRDRARRWELWMFSTVGVGAV